MSTFDKREEGFERKFAHDEELRFKATARRNKLTVKDYQTSQSQHIVFLMDCGRMMTNEAGGLSLLDHSLNAMLMVSQTRNGFFFISSSPVRIHFIIPYYSEN